MPTIVTKHAINRYRERLFSYSISDKAVVDILKEIADRGKTVGNRLCDNNPCFEVQYKGVFIVVVYKPKSRIVLTCLGESSYRKWIKAKGTHDKISQRSLFQKTSTY